MENITMTDLDNMYRVEHKAYWAAKQSGDRYEIIRREAALKVLDRLIEIASSRMDIEL